MRQSHTAQLPMIPLWGNHQIARELEAISKILDAQPAVYELAHKDLISGKSADVGRDGLSGEQVVRIAILKNLRGCSYRELAFELEDSAACRAFARVEFGRTYSHSTLQENVKKLSAETLEKISQLFMGFAVSIGMENGKKIRSDCTVTESNIHEPTDSSLLWDCVRVSTRVFERLSLAFPFIDWPYRNHSKQGKRRMLEIQNVGNKETRNSKYGELIELAGNVQSYGLDCLAILKKMTSEDVEDMLQIRSFRRQLEDLLPVISQVISQTKRRIVDGETVQAGEKVVSIFERHTDVIVKSRRDVQFGHKICLTTGTSALITDCVCLDGNPADSTLVEDILSRHKDQFGYLPVAAAFDGGFASKANLQKAKALGVQDVAFSKKRGIRIEDMVRTPGRFQPLRNFRAGIEGCISTLKRCFGLSRCLWRGLDGFKAYVQTAILTYNLIGIARYCLKKSAFFAA